MPSKQPALALGTGPRGVHDARRWVVERCRDLGRDDLAECAELGVSELVTNALLHGEPPIEVAVAGTRDHPRVEVRDAGPQPPQLPSPLELDLDAIDTADPLSTHGDDTLLTFGRGLAIVARASAAWGADIDDAGKVVWFEPVATLSEDDGPEGVITSPPATAGADDADLRDFWIREVPVRSYLAFWRHYRELRREVRLLALAHEASYPLARDLSDLFGALEGPLREGLAAEALPRVANRGARTTDLVVRMPRAAAARLDQLGELLDLADAFCREERLLSLARSDEQRRFQQWFLGEFVRQSAGGEPLPWADRGPTHLRRRIVS